MSHCLNVCCHRKGKAGEGGMTSDSLTSLSMNFTALFILLKINIIIDERFYIAKREREINEKKKKGVVD